MNTYVTDHNADLEKHPEADPGTFLELLANIEFAPDDLRTVVSGGRSHHLGCLC
jgi:superoxide dismutase, Fe-Mn family